jgi:hypothetical protein
MRGKGGQEACRWRSVEENREKNECGGSLERVGEHDAAAAAVCIERNECDRGACSLCFLFGRVGFQLLDRYMVDDQDQWDVGNLGEAPSNNIIGRRGSTKNFGQQISARPRSAQNRALTT